MKKPKRKNQKDKLPLKREFSAGGVVYKETRNQESKVRRVWLIGKHSGYRKWVLPKGLIEKGEKGVGAAVRETEEEMGVRAKVVGDQPIHKEEYWFVASYDEKSEVRSPSNSAGRQKSGENKREDTPVRRVKVYQEDPILKKSGNKFKVFKTVSFYLMKYVSGDPRDHDWEMSEAGWYEYNKAIKKLEFEGEREALTRAHDKIA